MTPSSSESAQGATWYRCPNCEHVFDVPAAKPPCPRCAARCDFRHVTASPVVAAIKGRFA